MHFNHLTTLPILLSACSLTTAISPPAPIRQTKGPLHARVLEVVGQQGYSQTPELQLMFLSEVDGKVIFSELGGEIPSLQGSSESEPSVPVHLTDAEAEAEADIDIPSGSGLGLLADPSIYYYGAFDMLQRQIGLHIYPEGDSELELAVMNYQNLEKLKIFIREPAKPGEEDQPWWVLDLDGYMMDTDPTDRSDVKVFESQKGGLPAFVPLSDMLGSS